ncbi:hypothetical protein GCM10023093_07200 [Nemorincola caseinilytica]|uniref:SIR2-like domain-containing protein n=1 Tax=Nemorincola caseinilytica TaxID=2054315 RepID=A0ABP8N5T0_9BACT
MGIPKEELFQLIRSEKVILWSGAGLSIYAGYPSGKNLGKKIVKSLPAWQRTDISSAQALDDLCEQFIRISGNNRKPLLDILTRVFSKQPKSIDLHKKLSKVPHFKTLITTNYDSLFELGYENNIQVVVTPAELPDMTKKQPHLFKIHGDLNHKESIIIAKSDYASYFNTSVGNVYWTTVTERIVNNNILFIGYALGDINIDAIISSVSKQLGDKQKKHFLVAPGFKDYEIESLLLKNIHYIDSTAERFIEELIANLKQNVVGDYRAGIIELDTFNKFLSHHDLTVDFAASLSGHTISRIGTIIGKAVPGILSISSDAISAKVIENLAIGMNFGALELNDSNAQFEVSFAGVKFFDQNDLASLMLIPRPKIETTFDIDFDNGFELRTIPVKLFHSRHRISVVAQFRNKQIRINMGDDPNEFQFSVEYPKPYGNPKDELEAFKLMLHLAEGVAFTVFLNGRGHRLKLPANEKMSSTLRKYVSYFEALLEIEKTYQRKFDAVDEITENKFHIMCVLLESTKNEEIHFEANDSLEITMSEFNPSAFFDSNMPAPGEISIVYTDFVVTLYGQTFKFKERTWRLYDPELVSLEILDDGSRKAKFRSRSNKGSDKYILEGGLC